MEEGKKGRGEKGRHGVEGRKEGGWGTSLNRSRYSGTTTGPLKTGPNQSTTEKKLVQTGCDRVFVVKFIVLNRSNITSCKLHI